MSRKLRWFCSIECWQLVISWGTGEETTISVEGEAIALENYSVAGIKRRKQNWKWPLRNSIFKIILMA